MLENFFYSCNTCFSFDDEVVSKIINCQKMYTLLHFNSQTAINLFLSQRLSFFFSLLFFAINNVIYAIKAIRCSATGLYN